MKKLNLFLPVLATIFMVAILTNCKNRELKIDDNINEQHETDVQALISEVETLRENNRHIEALMELMPDTAQMWEDLRVQKAENDVAIEEYMMELENKGLTAEQKSLLEYMEAKYAADKFSADVIEQLIIDAYKRAQRTMVDTMTFKADLDAFVSAFEDAQNTRSMYTIAVTVPGAGYQDLKVSDIDGLTATLTQNGQSYEGTIAGNNISFDNLTPGLAMVTVSAPNHLEVQYDINLPSTGNQVEVTIPDVDGGNGTTTFMIDAYPVMTVSNVNLVSTAEVVTITGEVRGDFGNNYDLGAEGANIVDNVDIQPIPATADVNNKDANESFRDTQLELSREWDLLASHTGSELVVHFDNYPGDSDILPSVKSTDADGNDLGVNAFENYAKIAKVANIAITTDDQGVYSIEVPVLTKDFTHVIELSMPIFKDVANKLIGKDTGNGDANETFDYLPSYGGNIANWYIKNQAHTNLEFGRFLQSVDNVYGNGQYPASPFVEYEATAIQEGDVNNLFDENDRAEAAGATVTLDIKLLP